MTSMTEKTDLIIGYLSTEEASDKSAWSGIKYSIYRTLLDNYAEVVEIGPLKVSLVVSTILLFRKILHRVKYRGRYNTVHSDLMSHSYARQITKLIRKHAIDVIIAPAAATELAKLNTSIPICYISDSSFGQLLNYYPEFSGLSYESIEESNKIEKSALIKAKHVVYSSDWARSFAIKYYGLLPTNTHVIPFGANIENIPTSEQVLDGKKNNPFNILFLAKNWERKGGDLVLETFSILQQRGLAVNLTICGCHPGVAIPGVRIIPYLSKNVPGHVESLSEILLSSNLLFVPSRAECTPIAFCEAAAYAVPVLSTDTGGISSIIKDGQNGFLLSPEATVQKYADKIEKLICDQELYLQMSRTSRRLYDEVYNWDKWIYQMNTIIVKTAFANKS